MIFSSPIYFIFFVLYFALHAVTPVRFRLLLIVAGSAVYYAYWNPMYLWVPFLLVLLAYLGALWVEKGTGTARKVRCGLVSALLLLPLAFFKYTGFLLDQLAFMAGYPVYDVPHLVLPIGISFVSFTMVAYVVDVCRDDFPVVRSPLMLSAYTMFFPQLIAGPILRPSELIPQLDHQKKPFDVDVPWGLGVFSLGLVKKVIFADSLAALVNPVFADPGSFGSLDVILAAYGFAVQIYCDFSGYTDMAIGSAALLGVQLPTNFRSPYRSDSVADFWRRWHITLSNWLKDYLYIPLGGNRKGFARQVANIMVTMLLGGLWHGANWTFVAWGGLHGVGISLYHLLGKGRVAVLDRVPRWVWVILTFHFVLVGWVLFRSPDFATFLAVMQAAAVNGFDMTGFMRHNGFHLLLVTVFFVTHRYDTYDLLRTALHRLKRRYVVVGVAFIWVACMTIGAGSSAEFIYFDF